MAYFQNIYHSDLSHRARAVYMYLKDHADSEGRCWPGIRTIAAELGLSRSTVKRALRSWLAHQRAALAGKWESQFQSIPVGVSSK